MSGFHDLNPTQSPCCWSRGCSCHGLVGDRHSTAWMVIAKGIVAEARNGGGYEPDHGVQRKRLREGEHLGNDKPGLLDEPGSAVAALLSVVAGLMGFIGGAWLSLHRSATGGIHPPGVPGLGYCPVSNRPRRWPSPRCWVSRAGREVLAHLRHRG